MQNEEKKNEENKEKEDDKKDTANGLLEGVGKIIPGFASFFKKAEKSTKFGEGIKKIREEMNRRFGKK